MTGVLYTRQRIFNEKPILDPKEFKKMLEKAELLLKAGAGLIMRSETIARQKAQHIQAYTEIIENLVVLNVNDFHNIHESHYSNATSMHDVSYFIMILLKALPEMLSIPVNHPNQEMNVHNEEGRKNAFNDLFRQKTHDERVERLLIHSYNDRIEQCRTDRSMKYETSETYMKTQDLIELIDYLGQLYV
ncbi:25996_t:CDS:2 [Gigaspora rosea]|nr:25996_t:CDS:2 [Gigaspora rosea]